jgi:hypothetical protein
MTAHKDSRGKERTAKSCRFHAWSLKHRGENCQMTHCFSVSYFQSMPNVPLTRLCAFAAGLLSLLGACARLPRSPSSPVVVWTISTPQNPGGGPVDPSSPPIARFPGGLLVIDSTTLRPVHVAPAIDGSLDPEVSRIAVITSFQGRRYHPETIRALVADSQVMARTASAIASTVLIAGNGMFIDFQNSSVEDIRGMAALSRAIADSARTHHVAPVGIIVPPGDTVAYPTSVLARAADFIVVRLDGEHGPGTPPGPPLSPRWITRQLGLRAIDVGVNRLIAEIPLFGYRWDRDGRATLITFAEARSLVGAESGNFRRDPLTAMLTAGGRDGWTVWVPDARSIETYIATVKRSGITRFALSGTGGADPEIWTRLPAAIRAR